MFFLLHVRVMELGTIKLHSRLPIFPSGFDFSKSVCFLCHIIYFCACLKVLFYFMGNLGDFFLFKFFYINVILLQGEKTQCSHIILMIFSSYLTSI